MTREGFIIPNASSVSPNFLISQPDQGDFQILGNNKYGVIAECEVTPTSQGVGISGNNNVVVVNGTSYTIPAKSIAISSGGPRFDLVVYDSVNGFSVITGTSSVNAVYPEIPTTATVLAAVYVPVSGSIVIIDKRNFLQTSVVGKNQDVIVENYGDTAPQLKIEGSGKISIGSGSPTGSDPVFDTTIERTDSGKLKVSNELVADTVTATSKATVNGKDVVTTETIRWGAGAPTGVSDIGDIYVDNVDGSMYIVRYNDQGDKTWKSFTSAGTPSGTVIMSFMTKSQAATNMPGWLALDGSKVTQLQAGALWDLFESWQSGSDFILPDMTQRFPIGASSAGPVGTYHGSIIDKFGSATATLNIGNIPSHVHRTATTTGTGGLHSHSATISGDGSHSHNLAGAGASHTHFSSEANPVIVSNYNVNTGMGDIPTGYINEWDIGINPVNTTWVRTSPSNRTSIPDPPLVVQSATHSHTVNVQQVSSAHNHTLPTHNSVGKVSPDPITVTPPSMSLLFYIKI